MAARLRSADSLLVPAVKATVSALDLTDSDVAVVRLALQYATQIDEVPSLLEVLGPKLLMALESLGASPRARSALKGGGGVKPAGKLAGLRSARAS